MNFFGKEIRLTNNNTLPFFNDIQFGDHQISKPPIIDEFHSDSCHVAAEKIEPSKMNFGGINNNPNSNGNLEMNNNELNENSNLIKLNDDCLLEILSYLNILDLMNIQDIHPRLDSVIEIHMHKYGEFSFEKEFERAKDFRVYQNATSILKFLGANLRSIALTLFQHFRENVNEVLKVLSKNCPNLDTLKCKHFNSDHLNSLKYLNPQLRQLKSFSFHFGKLTSDDELAIILNKTQILEELNILGNKEITGECLKNIRTLKSLNVSSCDKLKPECLINALHQNKNLRELSLDFFNKINQNVIDSLTGCHEIEFLSIEYFLHNNLPILNFDPIAKLACLKKLRFTLFGLIPIDTLLEELSKKNVLEELHLFLMCQEIKHHTIKCISKLTALKSLTILHSISDESLKMLKTLSNLEVLKIPKETELSTETIVDFIECCYKVKSLDIEYLRKDLLEKLNDIWAATPHRPKLNIFANKADIRIKSTETKSSIFT
uniref:CSON000318 protein n=1 Tax=Culicoides sonorensis TaxID=179676 RepID=A0A336MI68_CULSO